MAIVVSTQVVVRREVDGGPTGMSSPAMNCFLPKSGMTTDTALRHPLKKTANLQAVSHRRSPSKQSRDGSRMTGGRG
jgi:hypothetical protein